MKTSEIADYIAQKNPRLYVGTKRPFLPLVPPNQRRALDVGWIAFNLIQCLEVARIDDDVFERDPEDRLNLMHNSELGAFAFVRIQDCPGKDWKPVQWDGYGGLETWKDI